MKYFIEMSSWGEDFVREEGEFLSVEEADDNIQVDRWDKYTVRIVDEDGTVHMHWAKNDNVIDISQSPNDVFEEIRDGYGFTVKEFEALCKAWLSVPHVDED